jgi:cysteine dioxygenase
MPLIAPSLFADLDHYTEQVPLAVLTRWLRHAELELQDVKRFLRFHPQHYVRNLLHSGPMFQALVLCWRNGQRSPIHDHQGSNCAVKVLQGTALETIFQHAANGMIYAVSSGELAEGSITASQDADIHQISNLQGEGADLVTLHLYSPPLLYMNTYSLTEATVDRVLDPINEDFHDGAGI